jgi:NADH:ubiquinone oxidoreductase subunit C
MYLQKLLIAYGQYLFNACGLAVLSVKCKQDVLILNLNKNYLMPVCHFLKKHTHTQFQTLIDIVIIDYPSEYKRFEITYCFLSIMHNSRIFLKSKITSLSSIASITSIYSGAG